MTGIQLYSKWVRKSDPHGEIYTLTNIDASIGRGKGAFPVLTAQDGSTLMLKEKEFKGDFIPYSDQKLEYFEGYTDVTEEAEAEIRRATEAGELPIKIEPTFTNLSSGPLPEYNLRTFVESLKDLELAVKASETPLSESILRQSSEAIRAILDRKEPNPVQKWTKMYKVINLKGNKPPPEISDQFTISSEIWVMLEKAPEPVVFDNIREAHLFAEGAFATVEMGEFNYNVDKDNRPYVEPVRITTKRIE